MESNKENLLDLRNIKSLSEMNFLIPDYQRGYRWTSTQALEMLNDFREFIDVGKERNKISEDYYCLQPKHPLNSSEFQKNYKNFLNF